MKKKTLILASGTIVFFLILVVGIYYYFNPLVPKLQIGEHIFTYELAMTEQSKRQGLSGREKLPDNHGMLFVYPVEGRYGFWMNKMKFNLDFIWINNTTIVDIDENVPYPKDGERPISLEADVPVNRVLEVNAGTVREKGIKVGDTVTFLKK